MTRVEARRLSELHAELSRVYAEMAERDAPAAGANRKRPRIPVEISDVDVALARQEMRRLGIAGGR